MESELIEVKREDWSYHEFPISVAINVKTMRMILAFMLLWLLIGSMVLIVFSAVYFDVDAHTAKIVGLKYSKYMERRFRERVLMPLFLASGQLDMAIRQQQFANIQKLDNAGLKATVKDLHKRIRTGYTERSGILGDIRLLFNSRDTSYYISENVIQSDNVRCTDLGDFSCSPIDLSSEISGTLSNDLKSKTPWYGKGMLLFPPSQLRKTTFCEYEGPEFRMRPIDDNLRNRGEMVYNSTLGEEEFVPEYNLEELHAKSHNEEGPYATPAMKAFDWRTLMGRICKHEWGTGGGSQRYFAVSKVTARIDQIHDVMRQVESQTRGRVWILIDTSETKQYRILATLNKHDEVQIKDGQLAIGKRKIVETYPDIITEQSLHEDFNMTSTNGGADWVITRRVKDVEKEALIITMLVPQMGFVQPFVYGWNHFLVFAGIAPFAVI